MKSTFMRKVTVLIAVFVFCASLLTPIQAVAQGNGRGLGQAKKSQKFNNGHDARDGRLDGRGPRPRNVWTSRRIRRQRIWLIRRHRGHQRVRVTHVR